MVYWSKILPLLSRHSDHFSADRVSISVHNRGEYKSHCYVRTRKTRVLMRTRNARYLLHEWTPLGSTSKTTQACINTPNLSVSSFTIRIFLASVVTFIYFLSYTRAVIQQLELQTRRKSQTQSVTLERARLQQWLKIAT